MAIFKIDHGTKIMTKSAFSSASARASHKIQHVSITENNHGEISQMYIGVYGKCPLYLPDFNKNLNMLILLKIPKY